ncbi:MAG: extracellular solute-binding protein [Defluviitaleaceae bacterium]|nr:extracellular solute-binding protein [Defluviitaleaceae bacterium]
MKAKFMKLSLLALLVVGLLVIAACNRGGDDNGDDGADVQPPAQGDTTGDVAGTDEQETPAGPSVPDDTIVDGLRYFNPFPEPVTFTHGRMSWPGQDYMPEGMDFDNNAIVNLFSELTNVFPQTIWTVASRDDYETRMGLLIASGDLPDMFVASPQMFQMLLEGNMLTDLTDAWNSTASERLQQHVSLDPLGFQSAWRDGRLMGIPNMAHPYERYQFFWIREDWLNELDIPVPSTMDELIDAGRQFAAANLDDAPQAFGMAMRHDFLWPLDRTGGNGSLDAFFAAYGAFPQIWVNDGAGGAVFGGLSNQTRTALGVLQDMYTEGLIDPEFVVQGYQQLGENIATGAVGIAPAWVWAPWGSGFQTTISFDPAYYDIAESILADPDVWPTRNWLPIKIPYVGGGYAQYPGFFGVMEYIVVRNGFEIPEAIIKWLNVTTSYHAMHNIPHAEDFGFIEQVHGYQDVHGQGFSNWTNKLLVRVNMPLADIFDFGENSLPPLQRWFGEHNLTSWDDPVYLAEATPEDKEMIEWIGDWVIDRNWWSWGSQAVYGLGGVLHIMYDHVHQADDFIQFNMFQGPPSEQMGDLIPILHDLQIVAFTNIIRGAPLDEAFDEFKDAWLRAGGQRLTDEVNEWLRNN